MQPVQPILLADLFPGLHAELIALLRGLAPDDWDRPTVAGAWRVRDVAAHLLDVQLRQLSLKRDGARLPPPEPPIAGYADLVAFLNRLNAEWVAAARRLSPRVLTDLLDLAGRQMAEVTAALDPFGPAPFGVAWAGEETSANWFDVAREYTELWHHQQQIRDAVGALPLDSRGWLHPVLETFLRALPHAYREVAAGEGVRIVFEITGEAGGEWTLVREGTAWSLYTGSPEAADCRVRLDQDTAWRRMTKGLPAAAALARMEIAGDRGLGEPLAQMLAIMA
ncbi:MAG TPA: maleylpyruvate isomerase family mycothiol-dependent enzyme [Thermoanaerobaculia bacterium]|nr:maleylpyruvate isomerase family mycothiol-dependent enzyme [Thermoanaerobaculia bacterium]